MHTNQYIHTPTPAYIISVYNIHIRICHTTKPSYKHHNHTSTTSTYMQTESVCVCVNMRERKTERERNRERQREKKRDENRETNTRILHTLQQTHTQLMILIIATLLQMMQMGVMFEIRVENGGCSSPMCIIRHVAVHRAVVGRNLILLYSLRQELDT